MTAQNVWNFENGQTIYSEVCSSAYGTSDHSLLADYATADDSTRARLVGLDSNFWRRGVRLSMHATHQCDTSWNAVPMPLNNLTIE